MRSNADYWLSKRQTAQHTYRSMIDGDAFCSMEFSVWMIERAFSLTFSHSNSNRELNWGYSCWRSKREEKSIVQNEFNEIINGSNMKLSPSHPIRTDYQVCWATQCLSRDVITITSVNQCGVLSGNWPEPTIWWKWSRKRNERRDKTRQEEERREGEKRDDWLREWVEVWTIHWKEEKAPWSSARLSVALNTDDRDGRFSRLNRPYRRYLSENDRYSGHEHDDGRNCWCPRTDWSNEWTISFSVKISCGAIFVILVGRRQRAKINGCLFC